MKAIIKKTAAVAAVSALLGSTAAIAATVNTNAGLTVREAVALTNNTDLNFGIVDAPTDATTTYVLTNAGGTSTSGGNGAFISGSAAGDVTVSGQNGQTVDLSISNGACSVAGITLTAIEATYEGSAFNNTTANTATVNSGASMAIGGTVTIDVGTAAGAATCAYTVTVNYQ